MVCCNDIKYGLVYNNKEIGLCTSGRFEREKGEVKIQCHITKIQWQAAVCSPGKYNVSFYGCCTILAAGIGYGFTLGENIFTFYQA